MVDSRSLSELLPTVKQLAIEFLARADMELERRYPDRVIKVRVSSTYRDAEAQDALYAQGRSLPGNRVTNARGGDSWHQYRCAWDVFVMVDGRASWEREYFLVLGEVAKKMGLTWGGDWDGDGEKDKNDWDLAHFQFTGGLSLAELRAGKQIEVA